MPIPKIMHFIWVGKTIPDDRLRVIQQWHTQYPEFEIYLWTDPQGTKKSFGPAVCDEQQNKLLAAGINPEKLKIKDIAELAGDAHTTPSMEIIRYEIDRLCPNYGAASDLIRYEALYKYGGVYIDSDALPPKKEHCLAGGI